MILLLDHLDVYWDNHFKYKSALIVLKDAPIGRDVLVYGMEAVPEMLRRLGGNPVLWIPASAEITGQNPVPDEHRGKMPLMVKDWQNWAKDIN